MEVAAGKNFSGRPQTRADCRSRCRFRFPQSRARGSARRAPRRAPAACNAGCKRPAPADRFPDAIARISLSRSNSRRCAADCDLSRMRPGGVNAFVEGDRRSAQRFQGHRAGDIRQTRNSFGPAAKPGRRRRPSPACHSRARGLPWPRVATARSRRSAKPSALGNRSPR